MIIPIRTKPRQTRESVEHAQDHHHSARHAASRSRPIRPAPLADGVVYVSGTLPFDKDNNVVHVGDAAAQTRHVLETIKSVIETAGGSDGATSTMNHDLRHRLGQLSAAVNAVYAEYFPGDKPARYCVQCGLVKPDALVEIATVAHIGKK